ncbi:YdiY family protein [Croceicoccus sp. YJ47]|uniref:DUF481 domain-containing protein n=1 Tax=Croceicoccus sp. YJ47 TaxID=2798724 RepID=UPI001923EC04|nr:DUF481 domain-containing protein [Croceicoccus sp. YJ47]QQN74115.1 DUF481 domain-containing protein [Croceicoccus sp. YJ47]
MKTVAAPLILATAVLPAPARAALPEGVRAMVEAAIATGDLAKVETVVELARQTHPADTREINTLYQEFQDRRRTRLAEEQQRKEKAIRNAHLFDYWKGKGEVGAFRSTGNTRNTGFTGALSLERVGIDWQHRIAARVDYQRSSGNTTREQYRASYEPNYNFSEKGFVFGLFQYERDRFQGFTSRYSASGGVGYRVLERDGLQLSVKGGPALRSATLVPEGRERFIAALGAMDLDWQVTKVIGVTQEANMFLRAGNSSFNALSGVEAGIGDGLKARLSYSLQHETGPPDGALKTDTLSRFTLIYDF